LSSQIEELAEYDDGSKVWRTSCSCMGDDHLTFTVATDDEYPEVYLEFWVDVGDSYRVWENDKSFRWFRCMLERIKVACRVIFQGHVKMNGAFIFRGAKQIDELTETIQTHKEFLIKKLKEKNYKTVTKEN